MYCTGALQDNCAYVKTFLPADCWYYFCSFFINYGDSINFTQVKKRVCTKISTYDLTQKKTQMKTVLEIVEGDTPAAIKEMAQLFGNSFGVGVWKMFPKNGLPVANMGTRDTINFVLPTGSNGDKITLRYNTGDSKVSIII